MLVQFPLLIAAAAHSVSMGSMPWQAILYARYAQLVRFLLLDRVPAYHAALASIRKLELRSVLLVQVGVSRQVTEVLAKPASQSSMQQLAVHSAYFAMLAQRRMDIKVPALLVQLTRFHLARQSVGLALMALCLIR